MSEKTDFTRQYLAWQEALKFPDDSPEAFEEQLRLQQIDRRVQYLLGFYPIDPDTENVLTGELDYDIDLWYNTLGTVDVGVQVVTAEEIEDVPTE